MKPRVIDRLAHRAAAGNHVVDRLQDRAREPDRPRASHDEARRIAVEDEGWRHHARQAIPRMAILRADHVELPEHVVELEALGEDARAGPERRGERGRVPVTIDHRDVGRPCQRREARRPSVAGEQRLDERRGERVGVARSRAAIAASPPATTAPPFEGAGHVVWRGGLLVKSDMLVRHPRRPDSRILFLIAVSGAQGKTSFNRTLWEIAVAGVTGKATGVC